MFKLQLFHLVNCLSQSYEPSKTMMTNGRADMSMPAHLPVDKAAVIGKSISPEQGSSYPGGGRPKCMHHIPARYWDGLPGSAPTLLPEHQMSSKEQPGPAPEKICRVRLHVWEQLQTPINSFGLYCKYLDHPSHEPDRGVTLEELAGITHPLGTNTKHVNLGDINAVWQEGSPLYHPFLNLSTFLLSNWYYNSPSGEHSREHSSVDFDHLISMVTHPQFIARDMVGFSTAKQEDEGRWRWLRRHEFK